MSCSARWATRRRPERESLGPQLERVAEMLGTPLMPWQAEVAAAGLEVLEDGRPAYREVVVTVPRQSGKTTLMLAWEIHRCVAWPRQPQKVIYSAQTGHESRRKLIEDQAPVISRSQVWGAAGERIFRGIGNEGVVWRTGSRIDVLAASESAGHGRVVDLATLDEVFADVDDRREQAILPAMATRADAQLLVVSTAGTLDGSPYLRRKVELGRRSVEDDRGSGIAYFEWSMPDDADPYDEAGWAGFHPALGHTIGVEAIRHAAQTMTRDDFVRAYCNSWTSTSVTVFPVGSWESVARVAGADRDGPIWLGVDVTPDRDAAAIGVCTADRTLELVDHRPGTGWVVDRLVELAERYRAPVALDRNGPPGALASPLERAGVTVVRMTIPEMAQAAGQLYDGVVNGHLAVVHDPELDAAAAGAHRRPVGDSWVWGRRGVGSDVSPLVAVSCALWASRSSDAVPPPEPFVIGVGR